MDDDDDDDGGGNGDDDDVDDGGGDGDDDDEDDDHLDVSNEVDVYAGVHLEIPVVIRPPIEIQKDGLTNISFTLTGPSGLCLKS